MVSPGMDEGSTKPRAFYPLGLVLSELPGFSEYEYTYSRVRVLSCTATIVNDQPGIQELYGGYAIAPSHDFVQSQLAIAPGGGDSTLLYRNVTPGAGGTRGQFFGIKVGNFVAEANTSSEVSISHTGSVTSGTAPATFVIAQTGSNPPVYRVFSGRPGDIPDGWELARSVNQDSADYQAGISLTAAVSADLPPATHNQLSQLKRYRVRFPSTTKRSFRVKFVPYTFLTGNGPVTNLDLQQMPRFFSARRWMPLQWFSTAAGKAPLSLFGPYVAPLFAPEDVTQSINVSVYFHVRLQFAGQV